MSQGRNQQQFQQQVTPLENFICELENETKTASTKYKYPLTLSQADSLSRQSSFNFISQPNQEVMKLKDIFSYQQQQQQLQQPNQQQLFDKESQLTQSSSGADEIYFEKKTIYRTNPNTSFNKHQTLQQHNTSSSNINNNSVNLGRSLSSSHSSNQQLLYLQGDESLASKTPQALADSTQQALNRQNMVLNQETPKLLNSSVLSKSQSRGKFLNANQNKVKMRDHLKRLKSTKTEVSSSLRDIEQERAKLKELKASIYNDLSKNVDDLLREDDSTLKKHFAECTNLLHLIQAIELKIENKIENDENFSERDMQHYESQMQQVDSSSDKYKHNLVRSCDYSSGFKLVKREELEQQKKEITSLKRDVEDLRDEKEKYKQLFEKEQSLNQILQNKVEEQAGQLNLMDQSCRMNTNKDSEQLEKYQEAIAQLNQELQLHDAKRAKQQEEISILQQNIVAQQQKYKDYMQLLQSEIEKLLNYSMKEGHIKQQQQQQYKSSSQQQEGGASNNSIIINNNYTIDCFEEQMLEQNIEKVRRSKENLEKTVQRLTGDLCEQSLHNKSLLQEVSSLKQTASEQQQSNVKLQQQLLADMKNTEQMKEQQDNKIAQLTQEVARLQQEMFAQSEQQSKIVNQKLSTEKQMMEMTFQDELFKKLDSISLDSEKNYEKRLQQASTQLASANQQIEVLQQTLQNKKVYYENLIQSLSSQNLSLMEAQKVIQQREHNNFQNNNSFSLNGSLNGQAKADNIRACSNCQAQAEKLSTIRKEVEKEYEQRIITIELGYQHHLSEMRESSKKFNEMQEKRIQEMKENYDSSLQGVIDDAQKEKTATQQKYEQLLTEHKRRNEQLSAEKSILEENLRSIQREREIQNSVSTDLKQQLDEVQQQLQKLSCQNQQQQINLDKNNMTEQYQEEQCKAKVAGVFKKVQSRLKTISKIVQNEVIYHQGQEPQFQTQKNGAPPQPQGCHYHTRSQSTILNLSKEVNNLSKELDLEIEFNSKQEISNVASTKQRQQTFQSNSFSLDEHSLMLQDLQPQSKPQNYSITFEGKTSSNNSKSKKQQQQQQTNDNINISVFDSFEVNNPQTQNKKGINNNNTSLMLTNPNNTSSFAQDDDSSVLLKEQYQKNNQCSAETQTAVIDEALFPPFDRRICLRCKKNDMISPNYCKFENIQSIDELSVSSGRSSYKISKQHIYGTKISWSKRNGRGLQKEESGQGDGAATDELNNKMRKVVFSTSEASVNTIISSKDFTNQKLERRNSFKALVSPANNSNGGGNSSIRQRTNSFSGSIDMSFRSEKN